MPYTQHVQDEHMVLVVVQGAECSHQPVGLLSFFFFVFFFLQLVLERGEVHHLFTLCPFLPFSCLSLTITCV